MKYTEDQIKDYQAKKGSDRIQINNILCAVCVGALSVLLGLSNERLSAWAVGQLAAAIPCLITSSLAYAKTSYRNRDEHARWDTLGWATHTLGYVAVINAVGIMLFRNGFISVGWIFVCIVTAQFLIYSTLDIIMKRKRLREKSIKLIIYLLLLFMGLVLPVMEGWA